MLNFEEYYTYARSLGNTKCNACFLDTVEVEPYVTHSGRVTKRKLYLSETLDDFIDVKKSKPPAENTKTKKHNWSSSTKDDSMKKSSGMGRVSSRTEKMFDKMKQEQEKKQHKMKIMDK